MEAASEDVVQGKIATAKLEDVKSHLRYRIALSMDSPDNIATTVGHYLNLTGDVESINRAYKLYEEVTPEILQRVAEDFFRTENRTVVTLSTDGGEDS